MSWLKRFWQGRKVSIIQETRQVELPGFGTIAVARSVNCLGAVCPRPQLLTMQMVEELAEGEVFELHSDNPTSVETIPSLVMVLCSTHLATVRDEQGWRIYIRKGLAQ
jgi:TusA-related sulfurtransferase